MQAQAQTLEIEWVLTHGDPNPDNFLKDQQGKLYLTDWGELAIAPPERDLVAFTEIGIGRGLDTGIHVEFECLLRHYLGIRPTAKLHPEIFAFYAYRWAMQEIASCVTDLLSRRLELAEADRLLFILQAYLPIRHAEMSQALRELQDILD